jgi:hypothetical protein
MLRTGGKTSSEERTVAVERPHRFTCILCFYDVHPRQIFFKQTLEKV